MAMTHKERILAAARKQPVDKLPFGARIDVWYNYHSGHGTLPKKYKGCSMPEILRDLGAGVQVRLLRVWKKEYNNVDVVVEEDPPYTTTEFRTPLGAVTLKTMYTPEEGPWIVYEVELPYKTESDYPIIEYLLENTVLVPDMERYHELEKDVGDDGMVMTGTDLYSPMQQVMRYWMGYMPFFYQLRDNPGKVERLYELEKELAKKKLRILADSPVEIPMLCANWTDDIHTPVFKKYFTPWLREAADFFHARGKVTQVHADGEMRRLIPLFLDTGVDVAEAWSPAPMTSVTTGELRKAWGDKVTIWGGVPATLFEPQYSDEEFDAYVMNMFKEISPGNNFIVGMGDNLPFDGKLERIARISELIDKHGNLPIEM